MAKDHGSSVVKDDERYEGLRKNGMSKSRPAAIANAPDSASQGRQGQRIRRELEPRSQGQRRQPRAKQAAGRRGGKKSNS
jgi:hypothetical protein